MVDGSMRTSQAYGCSKKIEVQFKLVDNTTSAAFKALHAIVRGGLRPFYFLDADGTSLFYVLLTSDYNPVELFRYNQNNTASLVMEEQLATLT